MSISDLLRVRKSLLKECPFSSSNPHVWLNFLNKLEEEVRQGSKSVSDCDLLIIYDYAIETLPEVWEDENFIVIMLRLAILKGTESLDSVSQYLAILNLNAPSNTRLMVALAHYLTVLGKTPRVDAILQKAKSNTLCDLDKRLLEKAVEWRQRGLSLRPLMGVYDYVPINSGAWENKLGKDLSTHENFFPELKDRLRFQAHCMKLQSQVEESNVSDRMDLGDSDTSMELETPERCSPARRPPIVSVHPTPRSLHRIKEEEESEDEFLTVQMCSQPSTAIDEDPSCIQMSSQPSFSEDNNENTIQVMPLRAQSNEENKENASQRPPPKPLPKMSGNKGFVSGSMNPNIGSTPSMPGSDPQSDPISALMRQSSISVDGEKFIFLRQIARGGFSTVYCVMNKNRELRAIKRVELIATSADVLSVCENEVRLLSSLRDSRRVIALYSYELSPTQLMMVLELAEEDLKSHIELRQANGPLSDSVVTFFWTEMLACVKVIHDHRIVHLDLKPENFVIVRGMLKLIDLGISQRLPVDCTHMDLQQPMGSIIYMSPEQLTCIASGPSGMQVGESIEPKVRLKTDVWALGVILYKMAHGRSPFDEMRPAVIMNAIISPCFPIPFPHVVNSKIDKCLKWCLVRDIRQRASLDELLQMYK